jgi:UDP-4-amino-4-deoxy-L-arabinose formyltransferase/UDP-glucuronic acid dehydrogenase (UDP-4-keto-hexauronic acid decarboxylating)
MLMESVRWQQGAVVIGCRENTAEFIESLLNHSCPVSGIVTVSQKVAERNHVPGWADLKTEFGRRIAVHVSDNYSLADPADQASLADCRADVGFCIGWQRLLPQWFLDLHRNGVFGMHACANRLPNGRGRSPINWSVIEGATSLYAHIFRYNDQPDAGDLLSAPQISVEAHDDIQTLQQKVRVVFCSEVIRHWQPLVHGNIRLQPLNDSGEPERFYPKRSANDGLIDWNWSVPQIVNWVRAQTRPYPGAFTLLDGAPIPVCALWWHRSVLQGTSGTVTEVFRDGTCYVATGDQTFLHVLEHGIPLKFLSIPLRGRRFGS